MTFCDVWGKCHEFHYACVLDIKASVTLGKFFLQMSCNFVAKKFLTFRNKLLDGCHTRQRFLQLVRFSMITRD